MQKTENFFQATNSIGDSSPVFADDIHRKIFESARDGIIILENNNLQIIDANTSAINLLQTALTEIQHKPLNLISPFDKNIWVCNSLRRLKSQQESLSTKILVGNIADSPVEVEIVANLCSIGDRLLIQCFLYRNEVNNNNHKKKNHSEMLQKSSNLAQIAGKIARLGGWTIELPEWDLTWSDENCAIHEVPAGYKPTLSEGIGYFPEEYRSQVIEIVQKCALDGTPYDFELPKYTAQGNLIWVRSIGEAVRDENGAIIRLQGAFQDITAHKKIEQDLRTSREQYRQMVDYASDIIYKTDLTGRFLFVNPSVNKILKYSESEFLALHYLDVVHPDFRRQLKRDYKRQLLRKIPDTYYEFPALTRDGEEIWLGQHAQLLFEGDKIIGFQAISRDITQKRKSEEELRHLSLTDEMTGLYNHRGFMALAEHQLKLALNKKIEKKLLVVYVDLDRLKYINDTFGHNEGSRAICATAELLKQSFRQSDLLGRIGGDEFVVLAIEANEENTEMIVARMQNHFQDYNRQKNHPFELSFSFGISRFESETEFKIENLLNRADQEMYKQKSGKRRR